jgi:hypothetical protein
VTSDLNAASFGNSAQSRDEEYYIFMRGSGQVLYIFMSGSGQAM